MRRTLDHDIPLLLGETGTGTKVFARAVHQESNRTRQPFVAVSLAALPAGEIEAERFDSEDAAPPSARPKRRPGRIVQANGGTLYLDEIGALPPAVQLRLLAVLQDRRVTPVGSRRAIPVDLAIVCATRRELRPMLHAQTFREDLYYRLNGLVLRLPPLRECSDLSVLVRRILAREYPQSPREISPSVMDLFKRHAWPGNVRQPVGVLRAAALMCGDEPLITEAH
ncbi:MAG: sigma 54-interacting transcriptional regulator, partial [Burkholderiaceae bacterium]